MATLSLLLVCLCVAEIAIARQMNFRNNLGYTIWVGTQGNAGKQAPANGGFALGNGETRSVSVPDGWAGRFWGRTGCNFDGNGQGHCTTGDCGNRLQCNGAGGVPPATLAEITLNGDRGQDFYDVSLVDGYNLPVQMRPTSGGGNGQYWCETAGCNRDLNSGCPGNLKVTDGCKSSCYQYNDDRDCCRGSFNNANSCRGGQSAQYFKSNCPNAYSYAYDDGTSTFTCSGTDYDIVFSY